MTCWLVCPKCFARLVQRAAHLVCPVHGRPAGKAWTERYRHLWGDDQ